MTTKAIVYLQKAGDRAARIYAHNEAIKYYSKALTLVEQGLENLSVSTGD